METRKPARLARFAQTRTRFLLLDGRKIRTRRPASGVNKMILSKCWSIRLSRYVISQEGQNSDHHEKRIGLNAPGLQNAHGVREHLDEKGGEPHCAIDNPRVPPHRDAGAGAGEPAGAVDAAIDDGAVERAEHPASPLAEAADEQE